MDILLIVGAQVPVIPFVEVVGKVMVPPEQIGAIGLNIGVMGLFTVTVADAVFVHPFAV